MRKVKKIDFLKPPLIPDFELWDSYSTHYHVPMSKKSKVIHFFVSLHIPATSASIFYGPVVTTIKRRGGYSGILEEEGVDTGAYLVGNHGFRV